jgi:hypothetical protein
MLLFGGMRLLTRTGCGVPKVRSGSKLLTRLRIPSTTN